MTYNDRQDIREWVKKHGYVKYAKNLKVELPNSMKPDISKRNRKG